MEYNILALGDVASETGLQLLEKKLRAFKNEHHVRFTVVNGENISGSGLTRPQAEALFAAGADVVTLGNHTFGKPQIATYLDEERYILRPANFTGRAPGHGWQLIDCVRGDAKALRAADEEGMSGIAFIECEEIGHGTGYYAEMVQVYNPVTRQTEAAYTRTGYECPFDDRNLFLSADADYGWDGLRIVVSAVFGGYTWEGDCRVFTQRAQLSEVYAYGYDADTHSLSLGVHGRCEGLSVAALRAVSVSEYLGGEVGFIY